MISANLIKTIRKILSVARKLKSPVMFMGGIAVNVWGHPRSTYDIDITLLLPRGIDTGKLVDTLLRNGFIMNSGVRLISGLPYFAFYHRAIKQRIYVDCFIAETEYQKEALKRRKHILFRNIGIPIISAEDLILHKLMAGRERDLQDVRDILDIQSKNRLNKVYLKHWGKTLGVSDFLRKDLKI